MKTLYTALLFITFPIWALPAVVWFICGEAYDMIIGYRLKRKDKTRKNGYKMNL